MTDKTASPQPAQNLLTESIELYRLLFNNSNDGILVSLRKEGDTLPGTFILVNDAACQRLGYTREELLRMSPLDISEPLPTIPKMLETLARDGQVIHEEIHIAKDGRKIPVEISTRAFELNGMRFNLSIARDISERKQAEETTRLQSAALNAAANAIVITDRKGTIQWVNPAWSTLTGYSSQEAVGKNPRILKSGFQDIAFYKNFWDTILAGKVWHGELVNKRKDGNLYSEEQTITPVHDARGEITHFIAIKEDISERKRAEETTRLQSAALNAAANAIVITDRKGTIQWVNPAWSTLTGYSFQEAIGQNPRILKSGVQDEAYYKNVWDTILAGKVWHGELVNKRKDGNLYSEEQTITPIHDARGGITHFVAIKHDITERKQMEDRLKQMSIHDALTGLYNRGFFEEELARLERGRQFPVSIVMADIDCLKDTNDKHGHAAGDVLLKRAAQVLRAAFRSEDIIARIGGDEFAVILPNSDAAMAETVLLRVRNSLQKHNAKQADILLSISFGISVADKSKPLLEALKEADENMYREKRERGGS